MPYFVWAHGLTSSMASEDDAGVVGAWPVPAGWRLVRYDAPGHGTAPPPAAENELHWDNLGRRMLEMADEHGAAEFVAGGASMGAATALYAALAAPERVRALVLVVPPTAWDSRPAQADLYRAAADFLESAGMDAWIERARAVPPTPPWLPRPDRWDAMRSVDPGTLATVFRGAAASDLPPLPDVATIDKPALVLAWADDPGHPQSTAEYLVTSLPRSTMVVARSVEEVREWKGEVRRFLSSL